MWRPLGGPGTRVFWLCSGYDRAARTQTFAYSTSPCSTGVNKFLVPALANDPYVQMFCKSLPPRARYRPSDCPNSLKNLEYAKIQTFCECLKQRCAKPACPYGTSSCAKTCGGFCANFNTDCRNCGGCNQKCATGKRCVRGSCVSPQPASTTKSTTTASSRTTASTTTKSTTTASTPSTTPSSTTPAITNPPTTMPSTTTTAQQDMSYVDAFNDRFYDYTVHNSVHGHIDGDDDDLQLSS
ncbi:uncharacterized protein MYCGRDRAFT_93663 [Zymoseptoria tritici IPO323]|uniref:Uncharacterized protein n=1 Tax=Zymoseptoria tritici (strain CBS 115943 / IPO323) TaxID=336722 RepID=F9XEE1_ZYMTI|nr:uncharacterized protein MYCGRDRAFT_93663 [Zymoseptoria tritici IPO323]EGP86326.1 hypothetical protein MYCGRDRAFT_93663 [Zymoseptoria tritici IPO323]